MRIFPKGGTKLQVAAEGLQDVLPGPDGIGAADADGLVTAKGADAIGNEVVRAPVAPADDVARPGGGGAVGPVLRGILREERFQICAENEFRTTLGGTVGIMAAQRVIFPVSPDPFLIFI